MHFLDCLKRACDLNGVQYSLIDNNPNLIKVHTKSEELFFVNSATSCNNESLSQLVEDKYFSYQALLKHVKMPTTHSYLDPYCAQEYRHLAKFKTCREVGDDIAERFKDMCIIKRNRGSKGNNVFLSKNDTDIETAICSIFSHESMFYDYVLLAQEYVKPKQEYRVVVFDKKIQLIYLKDISNATYIGNLSPLHYQNAKAVLVNDEALTQRMMAFIEPIFKAIPIQFAGLDIILSEEDELNLIEINSKPGFERYISDNGPDKVVELYSTILRHYNNK